ncbi:hypothetical protein NQ317_001731, partial [Molorchus minor]
MMLLSLKKCQLLSYVNPTCRRCGEDEESALHVLCYCEGLARYRLRYLGQPFVEPEEIQKSPVNSLLGF